MHARVWINRSKARQHLATGTQTLITDKHRSPTLGHEELFLVRCGAIGVQNTLTFEQIQRQRRSKLNVQIMST